MELVILNKDHERIGTIDVFESLIWTDRYFECGEFELVTSPTIANMSLLTQGIYTIIEESEHYMIIEDINIKTDPVDGNKLIVKGRSGEIILDRRIVWDPVKFETEYIQDAIVYLLTENAFDPFDPARHISLLEFEASTNPSILQITTVNQYWGHSLYVAVVDLCVTNGIGFKIILTDTGKYRFNLYMGVDRSYEQTNIPYIIFSPNFENLKNSTYILTDRLLKTAGLVAGEKGVGNSQKCVEALMTDAIELERREMFIDAQDVSRIDADGNPISDEDYEEHLYERGLEELSKNTSIKSFSSEVDPNANFIYGEDFFLGDILQVSNEYGIEDRCRVIEVTRCQDQSGIKIYPIFTSVPRNIYIEERVRFKKYLYIETKFNEVIINLAKSLGVTITEDITGLSEGNINLTKSLGIGISEDSEAFNISINLTKSLDIGITEDSEAFNTSINLIKSLAIGITEKLIGFNNINLGKSLGIGITEEIPGGGGDWIVGTSQVGTGKVN